MRVACVAGGISSRARGQREALAAEPGANSRREATRFKAVHSHSPRDFTARIHIPPPKFCPAREQSRQLRRLGCGMRRYTLSTLREQIKDTHTAQTNRKRDLNIEELLMTNGVNPKKQNPSTLSNLSRISKQPEPQRECGVLEMKAITIIL